MSFDCEFNYESNHNLLQMNLTKNFLKYNFAHGSKAWFKQHVNDEFVKKAAELNYRSRAAFKLEQIQQKYKVLGEKIIDLGSAPGSWSQFALRYKKSISAPKINVVSVDILFEMKPIEGVEFYKCDGRDRSLHSMLKQKYGYFDSIISDMAPNFTGVSFETHDEILGLNKLCVKLALELSHQNCSLVMKTVQGPHSKLFTEFLQLIFEQSHRFKPKASRSESKQLFLVCKRFRREYMQVGSQSTQSQSIQQGSGKTNKEKLIGFINQELEQMLYANDNKKINKKQLKKLLDSYLAQHK